jgi:Tfp pilus assembly PilM family ATPase
MTKKIVTLSESQLTDLIRRAMNEANHRTENYMTFSNLQQMKRQIDMLMELDEEVIDEIIQNGHDWADDHISVAKENLD